MVVGERTDGTSSINELVIDLTGATDPAIAGAKAAALARLIDSGYTVPGGVVLPAQVVATALENPGFFRDALAAALDQLGNGPLAVRSSGIAEDLDDASHAGQYETVLNVEGVDQALDAVLTVGRSAESARISRYREAVSSGTALSRDIAILIQPMIQPDAAGVALSADPVTGERNDVVINAVAGLGDRLMDGETSAEEWRVSGDHPQRLSTGAPVLDPEEALQIAELARTVETEFGVPQDIEWAIEDGRLILLQARPITALPVKPDLPELSGFWTKELEHFPPPVSLMTWSIHQPNLRAATQAACEQYGLLFESLDIEYRAGEIYEHDRPLGGKEDDGSPPPWWLLGIFARLMPELRRRMRLARKAIRTDVEGASLSRWEAEWDSELEATAGNLKSVEMETLSDGALATHLDSLRAFTKRAFYIHFQLAFPCILPVYRLVTLGEAFFGWDEHKTLRLLHGTSYGSSKGSADLDRIAELIRRDEQAMIHFADPSITLEQIESSCTDIGVEIHNHLYTHGERMIQNDVMSATYREMPSLTVKFLQDRLAGQESRQRESAHATQKQAEDEAELLLTMRSVEERAQFELTLKRARWAYSLRDSNVYLTLGHPWALLRFGLLEAGRRLRDYGVLRTINDIFYCTFEEAQAAVRGQKTAELGKTAHRRRMEALWTTANPGPAVIGVEPAMPDFRGLPKEAREIHEGLTWAMDRIRAPQQASAGGTGAIRGVPASPGRYQGRVRIIRTEQEFHRLQRGDVLVCPSTSSSWAVLFGSAGALITDQGGSLSHPAIIAREHGIPAVVATVTATQRLEDGQVVIVDGSAGTVEPVEAR